MISTVGAYSTEGYPNRSSNSHAPTAEVMELRIMEAHSITSSVCLVGTTWWAYQAAH